MAGRLGVSKFVSLGNKADVSETDLLQYWAEDPDSKVILCYIEGLPDGAEFIRVARQVSQLKPVVAIKSRITQSGAPALRATEALERLGLTLARFQPELIRKLEQVLPDAASAANPIDLLGDALAERYRFALDLVIGDPQVDAVLVIMAPQAVSQMTETAQVGLEISARAETPVLPC